MIRGYHYDLIFPRNRIGNSSATAVAGIGIFCGKHVLNPKLENNQFLNVQKPVERET